MLSGSVGDYDAAAQTAIKSVLATASDVSTSAVRLTLTPGSVLITADIFFATQTGASFAATELSTGVAADATSLETAINAAFAADGLGITTTVQRIQSAPQVATPPPQAQSSTLVIVIVASAAVVVLLVAVVCIVKGRKAKSKAAGSNQPAREPTQSSTSLASKGEWDCFLTHDWGKDELNRDNHRRVSMVNEALKKRKFKTWFDEEMMVGQINKMMTDGIEGSKTVIVFVTKRYMEKVNGDGEGGDDDNCKFEYDYANRRKGNSAMYPVVMEPRCKDTRNWPGIVGGKLGGKLYADFSSDELLESAVDSIAKYITLELQHQSKASVDEVVA